MGLSLFSNPFVFAIAVTAAVGFVVYELITENRRRQRQQPARGRGRPPSPPPRGWGRPPSPPPSPPKNVDKAKENNIRRRSSDIRKASRSEQTASPDNTDIKSPSEKLRNSDYHEKNYKKNILDKIKNDTESINKNVEGEIKLYEKNISEGISHLTQNNLDEPSIESNLLSRADQQHSSISDVKEDADSDRHCQKNVTSSSSDFGGSNYQTAVFDKIRNDLIAEQSLCKACEYEKANAVFLPCRHCFLCLKCAKNVFDVLGKCSACHANIISLES